MTWTREQVLALAPDAAAAKAGSELAANRRWAGLGHDGAAAWGLCQGSGKTPYQTRIDLGEPAFRCSCPSRKFPCKHGIALMLLLAEQPAAFTDSQRPPWVQEWLDSRQERNEKKAARVEAARAEDDDPVARERRAEAAAKRGEKRAERVAAGVADLELFLQDLVRQGLATVQAIEPAAWEKQAARLVDAQAPGLRRMVHELGATRASGDGWQHRFLDRLGLLNLLLCAHHRIDSLPAATQADVRGRIGWTQDKEEVLAASGVSDRWQVLGQVTEEDDLDTRIRVQRSWLWGHAERRPALLLQFAVARQPFESMVVPGTVQELELAFFPGEVPLRALIKSRRSEPEPAAHIPGFDTAEEALLVYGDAVARHPWLERYPLAIRGVVPRQGPAGFVLCDRAGHGLPLHDGGSAQRSVGWELMALSGGHPVDVFGEWDGERLRPLTARAAGEILALERSQESAA